MPLIPNTFDRSRGCATKLKSLSVCFVAVLLLAGSALAGCGMAPPFKAKSSDGPPLQMGGTATYDGLRVTLVSAGKTDVQKNGFSISVSYDNRGVKSPSYGFDDWKVEDASGVPGKLIGDVDLGFGSIPPAAVRSGSVYFVSAGAVAKVIYQPSPDTTPTVWSVR